MTASEVGQGLFSASGRLFHPTRDNPPFSQGAAQAKVGQVGQRWDKGGTKIFVYYTVFLLSCPTLKGTFPVFHTCEGDNRHYTSGRSGTRNVVVRGA